MRGLGALLQARERLGGSRLLPVLGIGIGHVDRRGHGDDRTERREVLDQLDIVQVERHARMHMRIPDLDHVFGVVRAPKPDHAVHGDPLGLAMDAVEH